MVAIAAERMAPMPPVPPTVELATVSRLAVPSTSTPLPEHPDTTESRTSIVPRKSPLPSTPWPPSDSVTAVATSVKVPAPLSTTMPFRALESTVQRSSVSESPSSRGSRASSAACRLPSSSSPPPKPTKLRPRRVTCPPTVPSTQEWRAAGKVSTPSACVDSGITTMGIPLGWVEPSTVRLSSRPGEVASSRSGVAMWTW